MISLLAHISMRVLVGTSMPMVCQYPPLAMVCQYMPILNCESALDAILDIGMGMPIRMPRVYRQGGTPPFFKKGVPANPAIGIEREKGGENMTEERWDITISNEICPRRTQNHAYCLATGKKCLYTNCIYKRSSEKLMKKVNTGDTSISCA